MKRLLLIAVASAHLVATSAFAQATAGTDCPPAMPSNGGNWFTSIRSIFEWNPFTNHTWCSQGSKGMPGWALRAEGAPPTTDSTASFKDAHAKAKAGTSPLPANAGEFTYVLVGGLYTEHFPGYMRDDVARLESRGLNVRRVDLDTDAGVATNAAAVRDAVLKAARETGKKVVLLGHSKGGVDATAALSLYPELKPHVKVMIAMQSPYGGTPIAQDIQGCPRLRDLTDNFVKRVWSGSADSMKDLTYDSRRAFLAANPFPSDVPVISLASSRTSFGTVMRKSLVYLQMRYGGSSDGLVIPSDAIVPGGRAITLDDMDHAESTNTGVAGFREYHPGDVTEALIAVALQ